uniref:Uncharacterized protein n=1 Tax=Catharus ustulatus TaxID=91951 RepID=A0A8C3Y2R1_CATUS
MCWSDRGPESKSAAGAAEVLGVQSGPKHPNTIVPAGVALVGIPLFISALGFTGAGIAAGSIAAKMMSAAAIANGGGVAAGSTVAVLQSVGEWGGQGSWASSPWQGTQDCILGLL